MLGTRELAMILGVKGCIYHGCWGRAVTPAQACFIGSLGGRTGKFCKDVEICYGYKAGGTAGVKEMA